MLKNIIFATSLALLLGACEKLEKVSVPSDFDVTTDKASYAVGDTVRFMLHGNPDIISVYTGELGNNYAYINGRIAEPRFTVTFEEQNIDGQQLDQLHIYVSKDFNEDYSYAGVTSPDVTWTDISDRFSLVGPYKDANKVIIGTNVYTNVGTVDFTDLLEGDQTKLFFACRYTAEPWATGKDTHITRVRNFVISSQYETLKTELVTWAGFGWQLFTKFAQDPARKSEIQESSKVIQFRVGWGNKPDGSGTYQSEGADNWVVSAPVYLDRVQDMGPDRAIGIKGVNDVSKDVYEYTFDYPGQYEVVFNAQNTNAEGSASKLVKIKLTVTEKTE